MFALKEWWKITVGDEPYDDWDGKVVCYENNLQMTLRTNITRGFLACYTFTLVTRGWVTLRNADYEVTLRKGDLYVYLPGAAVAVTKGSADYQALCLLVDEFTTLESPAMRDMAGMAFFPTVHLSVPRLSLSDEKAALFEGRMREIISYQQSQNVNKEKLLRMLYAIFLVDLQDVLEKSVTERQVTPRVEEIFVEFNRLLSKHFIEHRDIAFYADRLCVTKGYLSRIVRRVSGRTVGGSINQLLLIEACYLLRTSSLSISQIAGRLRFAELAAFTHFFKRMKGLSPREYRESK